MNLNLLNFATCVSNIYISHRNGFISNMYDILNRYKSSRILLHFGNHTQELWKQMAQLLRSMLWPQRRASLSAKLQPTNSKVSLRPKRFQDFVMTEDWTLSNNDTGPDSTKMIWWFSELQLKFYFWLFTFSRFWLTFPCRFLKQGRLYWTKTFIIYPTMELFVRIDKLPNFE